MNTYPDSILKLIQSLSTLPGIGRKTAERLALHILHAPLHEARTLAADILELKEKVKLCRNCFALSDGDKCRICANPNRDSKIICVVENPADMVAIEKAGVFKGHYHILGGALSPMDGIGPDEIRLKELFKRVHAQKKSHKKENCAEKKAEKEACVNEVIIATGTDVEGESTASYIYQNLKDYNITVSRIASGVPMGGDLQYVDQVTMQRAMEGRHGF
ncbi:Recombination protein recR [Desulfamplus magnetovallimortis]|uniref:Recombination protein RecR n=1 Tax=Desulfamplus magnetovallimortis TaxID=1246637 RepID=A0A1W1H4L4_9BACT|nr:recombination mediator RecR [Desulfamplus magnetovallimortis]SLM27384.1 Recombination protein recR [Desulfamplus magnetovallimortis]